MKPSTNKLFISFIIAVFIICLVSFLYYSSAIGFDDEQTTLVFLSLFLSSFVGAIFYLPAHLGFLNKKKYSFFTAISNYFLMLVESSTMVLGFTLSNASAGWYSQWFLILLYIFFGFHMFSYPLSFKKSLASLAAPLVFIGLNFIGSSGNLLTAFVSSSAKAGYVFALSLIIAGLWTFVRFCYVTKRNNADEKEKSNILKTIFIITALYALFIFLPGLWYLIPGIKTYFFGPTSIYFLIISIIYFVYILIEKIKTLGNEITGFMGGKKEVEDDKDGVTN